MKFELSVPDASLLPNDKLFEVALVGRSNVGKSTFINKLSGQKSLAFVSKTPGSTRLINSYRLDDIRILDLPGYGFAKASKLEAKKLEEVLRSVIEERDINLIALLNDARRSPEDLEDWIRETAFERGVNFLVIATKADKLKKNEVKPALDKLARSYGLEPSDIVLDPKGFISRIKHLRI
jgi:GTP-binding protein